MNTTEVGAHEIPYIGELRARLVDGISRRRRRRRSAAAGIAAVTVAATLVALAQPGGDGTALAIERTDGWIELRVRDAAAGADEMTADLRGAGIDGEVLVVPVESGRVGAWVTAAELPNAFCDMQRAFLRGETVPSAEGETRLNEVVEQRRDVLRIRETFADRPHDGFFVFVVGRAATGSEKADREVDVLALAAQARCGIAVPPRK
jgi:hypothetical protein